MSLENNFVAKHDFNRASVHKDKKKAQIESKRKQKHKGKTDGFHD